jgi:hypothetical protein
MPMIYFGNIVLKIIKHKFPFAFLLLCGFFFLESSFFLLKYFIFFNSEIDKAVLFFVCDLVMVLIDVTLLFFLLSMNKIDEKNRGCQQ